MGEWVTKNGHNLHISKTLISIMLWNGAGKNVIYF
uniref:Uncharacterized protein n=1 Tax=Anguilla anguilla TaxID=7936 RepID=A0A0E9PWQ4_ANGAN